MSKRPMSLPILLERLREAGYLESNALIPNHQEPPASIWIQALQMIGGWLAALFLLLAFFVGLNTLITNALGWVVLGTLLSVASTLYLRRAPPAAFSRQFALALHFAGQVLFLWGCIDPYSSRDSTLFPLLGAIAEFALLRFATWRPIRILAGLCAIYLGTNALLRLGLGNALSVMSYASFAFYLFAGLLWWREKDWMGKGYGEALDALAWAFSLASMGTVLGVFMSFSKGYLFSRFFTNGGAYAGELQIRHLLLCAGSLSFTILLGLPWLKNRYYGAALLLSLVVLALTWRAPTLGVGALFLVFGFRRAHGLLSILGGLLFIYGVSIFYYDLQLSLLIKSGLMVLGGALLLCIRALVLRANKEQHE